MWRVSSFQVSRIRSSAHEHPDLEFSNYVARQLAVDDHASDHVLAHERATHEHEQHDERAHEDAAARRVRGSNARQAAVGQGPEAAAPQVCSECPKRVCWRA